MDRLEVTYTDENRVELGMIDSFSLDLAYGSDENDFELTVPIGFTLPRKSLVYIDGTEWGGVVRGCRISTLGEEPTNTITGQTWHGILAESCIIPDAGSDHYRSSGEANAAIRAILARQGLDDLFDASGEDSGIMVEHEHDRFADAYASIRKMLRKSGAKLKIAKEPGRKPTLYAVEIGSYVDDGSAGRLAYEMRDDMPYNHIIGLGNGEMQDRAVVHLFADADGVVSETQTLFGLDERQYVYELSSNDDENLREECRKKLEKMQNVRSIDIRLNDGESYDVGDIVGIVDDDSGKSVMTDVTKVIVKVDDRGTVSVSNEIGEVRASGSSQGRYSSGSTGLAYKGGPGIGIVGAVISADVTDEKLAAVEAKADSAGKVAAAAVKRVKGSAPIVAEESGGTVSVSHAASGVAGGSYGPASDSSPSWGDTVTVGSRLVIDGAGHVKDAAGRKLVMPSSTATQSTKGLMSAADKQRVDAYPWDAISGKPATFVPAAHNHDDRYYSEAEMDTKLAGKSDTSHVHAWDAITGKPASFPAASHTHDDRYYTETEINTKLAAKSDTAHTHAWSGITGKPASYPPSTHNHDAAYAAKSHTHQWADVTGKPASFPPSAHTHAWADVSGKPTSFPPSSHSHGNMAGATTAAAGKAGFVPAPSAGAATRYLRSDGTWQTPPDTNTVYTHPTTPGNRHVPAGGSSGQILRWGADGTAVWGADNNTTYAAMAGATASSAGKAGLVPAPAAGNQASFLRGDGAWAVPAAGVPAAHSHSAADIASGALAIARGGTGASNRKGAFDGLSFLGENPIKTAAGDTVGAWTSLGSGYAWYSVAGQLSGQPSQYGFLVSYVRGGDVWQLWHPQSSGDLYVRSGNGSGWAHGWRKSALEAYPVGAVYLSFSATSPASLFGGTWVQISGAFLRAANDTGTGGSNTHTLTVAQAPKSQAYSSVNINGDAGFNQMLYTGAFTQGSGYVYFRLTYMGGGAAHNNMPYYQDVYAWRRTA